MGDNNKALYAKMIVDVVLGPILERVSLIKDLNIVDVVLGPTLERVTSYDSYPRSLP